MKKFFALFALIGLFAVASTTIVSAQEETPAEEAEMQVEEAGPSTEEVEAAVNEAADKAEETQEAAAADAPQAGEVDESSIHQVIKDKVIDGNVGFMSVVIICLILGLALAIERIIYLSMASTDTNKLLNDVEGALSSGGIDAAKEVCRNTKGPVASIFYQGLERAPEGADMAEKSVIAYGSVQMGLLEKGLSWIQLFIALAPMLGFMGTVIGMIDAFDQIAAANNISPAIVASGIQVALITTVTGLIVAIILQIFYNLIVAKVDSIVNQMENASIGLIDLVVKHNNGN